MRAPRRRSFGGMSSERGQAGVEWIGLVLLVAIALAALARFAPRADGRGVGATVLHSVTGPAGRTERPSRQVVGMRGEKRTKYPPPAREGFAVPPLIPDGPALLRRARRGVGAAWRRAWLGCLAYERMRYALLHPESRFPGYTMPRSELLRIANDCISPVDLVRDWRLVRGR